MKKIDNAMLHKELMEIKSMLFLLSPKEYSVSYMAKQAGVSRQAVSDYIARHGERGIDFWKSNGKVYVSEKVALKYITERRILRMN